MTGGVVGDESLFDTTRYNAGWPERFITQNQTGPLSSASVDDGYAEYPTREAVGDPAPVFSTWAGVAVPSPNPAETAAGRLTALLEAAASTSGEGRPPATRPRGPRKSPRSSPLPCRSWWARC